MPVTPGALVGPPATVHTTGETASEQTFFPSEDPLAAAEKVEGDTASEPIVVPDEPFASVVSSDTIACHYQDLVEAARQVFARAARRRSPDSGLIIASVNQSYRQLLDGDGLLAETVRHRRDFCAWPERAANVAVLSHAPGGGDEAQ